MSEVGILPHAHTHTAIGGGCSQSEGGVKESAQRHGAVLNTFCGNDPSAGSPTETLLRLHLPLNGKV